jgi:hypothetical protein
VILMISRTPGASRGPTCRWRRFARPPKSHRQLGRTGRHGGGCLEIVATIWDSSDSIVDDDLESSTVSNFTLTLLWISCLDSIIYYSTDHHPMLHHVRCVLNIVVILQLLYEHGS